MPAGTGFGVDGQLGEFVGPIQQFGTRPGLFGEVDRRRGFTGRTQRGRPNGSGDRSINLLPSEV